MIRKRQAAGSPRDGMAHGAQGFKCSACRLERLHIRILAALPVFELRVVACAEDAKLRKSLGIGFNDPPRIHSPLGNEQ